MHIAIEAPGVGTRGGKAILEALLAELVAHRDVSTVTVYGLVDDRLDVSGVSHQRIISNTYAHRIYWAEWGWAEVSKRYDHTLSFSGFARPASTGNHTCFIHNALYYEDAARLLPAPLQVRLEVLKTMTHVAARAASRTIVQSPHMASHVWDHHKVRADVLPTVPPLPEPSAEPILKSHGPHMISVGKQVAYRQWELLSAATTEFEGSVHFIGHAAPPGWAGPEYFYPDLSRAQVHRAMREADALVMTSVCESMGLPLYEAMQVGLPVIAPRLPYATFACGDAAHYFEASNVESLSATIRLVPNLSGVVVNSSRSLLDLVAPL